MKEVLVQLPNILYPRAPIVVDTADYLEALLASPFIIFEKLLFFVSIIGSNTQALLIGLAVLLVLFGSALIAWWYLSRHTLSRKKLGYGAVALLALYYIIGIAASFVSYSTAGVNHEFVTIFLLLALVPVYFTAASLLLTAVVRAVKGRSYRHHLSIALSLILVYFLTLFINDSYWKSFGEREPYVFPNIPVVTVPTHLTDDTQEGGGPDADYAQNTSPALSAALFELERHSFTDGDVTWENKFGSGETFGPIMFRVGDEIYSRHDSQTEPVLELVVDGATFAPDRLLTEARVYRPVVNGGYRPHFYRDKDFFYCGIGAKGMPNVTKIALPVEFEFEQLPQPFNGSDGLSEEERLAWQSTETEEYTLIRIAGSDGRTYDPGNCFVVR